MPRSFTAKLARALVLLVTVFAVVLVLPVPARAQTCSGSPPVCIATTSAELSNAISIVNASGGTVSLGANIILTSTLPAIDLAGGNITVEGNGFTLSGANTYQGLSVTNSVGGPSIATIQNLTIANTIVVGGTGGSGGAGAAGGGGGAAIGAALSIASGASVSVNNVSLISNSAIGGAGGTGSAITGLGTGGNGGAFNTTGGGGGAGGIGGSISNGNNSSGFGGGGGGAAQNLSPGFGAPGGSGNFNGIVGPASAGGAGGSTDGTVATSLFGGGSGGTAAGTPGSFFGAGGGGGGAAIGAGVFVQSGGALTVSGPFFVNGNSVTGGVGGTGGGGGSAGSAGSGFGAGLFLDGSGTLTVSTATTATIADAIADGAGSGGAGSWSLSKDGAGTLVLGGVNTYGGGTNLLAGTLSVAQDANLGATTGALFASAGTTLQITGTSTFSRNFFMNGAVGVSVTPGQTATWSGNLLDESPSSLQLTGGGTLALTNAANVYSLGTSVSGNSTLRVNADGALGDPGGGVTLGGAVAGDAGTLAITSSGFTSSRAFTFNAGGGTIDTGGFDATLSGVAGGAGGFTKIGLGTLTFGSIAGNTYSGSTIVNAGTLRAGASNIFGANPSLTIGPSGTVDFDAFAQTLNTISGSGSLALTSAAASLTIGGTNASSTFDGAISGAGGIFKVGSGTLTLGGANTFTGGLTLQGGTVRVASDANLGGAAGTVAMSDATTLDLTNDGTFAHTLAVFGTSSLNAATGRSVTWSGQIIDNASPGTLRLTGGGTFALTNTNSYSGGTIVTGGSRLNVGADAALGAVGGAITLGDASSGGTLGITAAGFTSSRVFSLNLGGGTIDTGTNAATLSGNVSGTGGLTKIGTGALTLSGANTFSGGLALQAGTVRVSSDGNLGGAGVAMSNATTLDLATGGTYTHALSLAGTSSLNTGVGQSVTWSGQIGDGGSPGTLQLTGGGTFALTNTNSYSGGTIVTGGSRLNFGADAALGAAGAGLTLGDATTSGTLGITASAIVSRGITLGAAGGTVDTAAATVATLGGTIGGTGGLAKSGGGTLTLSGTNTFSGGLALQAGTVRVSSGGNLGTGSVAMSDATTLDFTSGGTYGQALGVAGTSSINVGAGQSVTWSGQIGDNGSAGTLRLTGGGTFALTNAGNTYSGGTVVTGGSRLNFGADAALGAAGAGLTLGDATTTATLGITGSTTSSRGITLGAAGGTVDTAAAAVATLGGTIGGTGGLTKSGTGTLTLSGTNTFSGGLALQAGTVRVSSDANLGGAGVAMIDATTLDLATGGAFAHALSVAGISSLNTGAGQSVTWSGQIADGGSPGTLRLTGGGIFALTNTSNSYSGGTIVTGGSTLNFGSSAALGSGGLTLGDATTTATLGLNATTFSGAIALGAVGATINTGATSATVAGTISGAGALTKSGSGTLTLSGTNTFTGGLALQAGTLRVSSDGNLGGAGTVAMSNATLLDLTSGGTYGHALSVAGTSTVNVGAGQLVTWSGQIGGTGGLTKSGGGTLALSGSNTFGGGLALQAGTLRVSSDGNLGGVGTVAMSSATTLDFTSGGTYAHALSLAGISSVNVGAGQSATWSGQISDGVSAGTLQITGGGTFAPTNSSNSYSGGTVVTGGSTLSPTADAALGAAGGGLTLGDAATTATLGLAAPGNFLSSRNIALGDFGATIDVAGATAATLGGTISGAGGLTKSGSGALTLTGANTYTGGTFLNGGSLITNATTLRGSVVTNSGLVFYQPTDGAFSGFITGSGGLTKTGPATLTLSGLHEYTGLTHVQEGTLVFNGQLPDSILVDPGATLRGTGIIGGSLDVFGSLFIPAPGSLATLNRTFLGAKSTTGNQTGNQTPTLLINGDLTLEPGSIFNFTLSPGDTIPVVVNGVATLAGTHLQVNVDNPNPARVTTYQAIAANGGLTVTGGDVSTASALLVPYLRSYPQALMVTVVDLGVPLASAVLAPNAVVVAGALDAGKTNLTGDFGRVIAEVTALDDQSLDQALKSLAGEIHASVFRLVALDSLAMTDMIRNELSDREHAAEEGEAGRAAALRPWFQIGGDHISYKSGEFSGGTANVGGGGGGVDFKPTTHWTVGGGGSLSLGGLSLSEVSGSSQMTAPRAFFYSGFGFGPFYVHFGGSRSWTRTTTNRSIQFAAYVPDASGRMVPLSPGIPPSGDSSPVRPGEIAIASALARPGVDREADSDQQSTASDAWSEWQFTRKFSTWTIDTKLGLRAARFSRTQFGETGADSISLDALTQTLSARQTNFDFHAFRPKGTWRPNILVTYRREFGDDFTSANLKFAGNPDTQFAVRGFPVPKNTFQGLFGITMASRGGLLYTLEYQTLQSSEESRHSLRCKVRLW